MNRESGHDVYGTLEWLDYLPWDLLPEHAARIWKWSETNIKREDRMSEGSMKTEVQKVLDAMRPVIQEDGGDIELVSVNDSGVVEIRFLGACIGCPSRSMTLQSLIDRNLREYVPGFSSVTSVES